MRLSDKQAHQLVMVLQASTQYNQSMCYSQDDRIKILNVIIRQQDETIIDLKTDKPIDKPGDDGNVADVLPRA